MSDNTTKDNILSHFVFASNKHDFNLDISLLVNGALVSGTLISAQEYFQLLSKSFEDGNDISQALGEQLAKTSEQLESQENPEQAEYIHLKNSQIYSGGSKPTPSKSDILWRGKLSEVDSFFLGKITETKRTASSK
ncbi:gas vesicle accessory protein GvpU [Oceanobacillus kapialis]|uniref:Gas vesicle accessory protein GvpU n=1 Tax=Oceanobacillus kapialis TaxID=481353 RepID=A0ABW5PY74_9BACI